MVRLERAMTTMGMAMAEGKEILSITHGHHPAKPPCHRPPISIKGEWGILQREARRGATFGRAKTTSNELKWATVAKEINLHRRQCFHRAHRIKPTKPTHPNHLNHRYRARKAQPKKWRDLAKLQDLSSYIANEMHKVDCIAAEIAQIDNNTPQRVDCCVANGCAATMEDCRVVQGCSQSSSCCVTPPPTPLREFNTKLMQMEKEMENNNKQLQNEMEALDAKMQWIDAECPDEFATWNTHRILDNHFASWQEDWEDMEREASAFKDTSIMDTSIGSTILKEMLVELEAKECEFELETKDMDMYFNTSHDTYSPELPEPLQSKLSATAPPFIPPPGMPPQYTPVLPPSLSASTREFTPGELALPPTPQSPQSRPTYNPTTPTYYYHEEEQYPSSPTFYSPPTPTTPPASPSPQYSHSPISYLSAENSQCSPCYYPVDSTSISTTWDDQSEQTYSPPTPAASSNKAREDIKCIVNQNVNGLTRAWKMESMIDNMITNNIDAYLIQETWLTGDWEKEIRGYLVIHHNHEPKKEKKKGREKHGVAIILSPHFKQAYKRAGRPKPITTGQKGKHSGRFIGITLAFPDLDTNGKKVRENLKLFIASIYHPHEESQYRIFNDQVTSLLKGSPQKLRRY